MSGETWAVVASAVISTIGAVYAARAAKGADDVREVRQMMVEHLRDHANG